MYSVELLRSAARALEKVVVPVRRRIAARIDRLAQNPRDDAVKLRGTNSVWRVRVGDYRILYQIEDDRLLILVIKIGHRGTSMGEYSAGMT